MVCDGLFREDLFYRFSAVALRMPALREHSEDIPEIARELWERGRRDGWRTLNRPQVDALMGYDYPGNVRELANLLDRAYALDERDFSRLLKGYGEVMSDSETFPTATLLGRSDRLEDITRLHVRKVLEKHGGNVSRAAAALDVSRNTVLKYRG